MGIQINSKPGSGSGKSDFQIQLEEMQPPSSKDVLAKAEKAESQAQKAALSFRELLKRCGCFGN